MRQEAPSLPIRVLECIRKECRCERRALDLVAVEACYGGQDSVFAVVVLLALYPFASYPPW